jgi:serine/threonine protein kinase
MDTLTNPFMGRGPGTPDYSAPEQLMNRKAAIDYRTDQFVLGIVFAQLLLGGRHPFDPRVVNEGDDIPRNILRGRWAKGEFNQQESEFVRPVLQKMLGREPHQRYREAGELEDALRNAKRRIENG